MPGQPSGCQGPVRPIQRPVDFSTIENIANPRSAHEPAIAIMPRQASARGTGPPMKREASGSDISSAQPSRSTAAVGRSSRRCVSRVGPTCTFAVNFVHLFDA